jgi:hypothetical protein
MTFDKSKIDMNKKAVDDYRGTEGEKIVCKFFQDNYTTRFRKYHWKWNRNDFFKLKKEHTLDFNTLDKNKDKDWIKDNIDINQIDREYELKTRNVNHDCYPDIGFSINKLEYALERQQLGIKQTFLVKFLDGIFMWNLKDLKEQKDEIRYGILGNWNRNDKTDDAFFIKKEYFTRLSDKHYKKIKKKKSP